MSAALQAVPKVLHTISGTLCTMCCRRCRDHRKLGQQLDLFSINDSGGAGLVFWHPKVCSDATVLV